MIFGLIRERKNPPDHRVVLSPTACQKVLNKFPQAGIRAEASPVRVFTDQEYLERLVVDPYHMLDISLTKKFFNDRLNFVLGAKNIFNVEEIPARTVVANYGYNTIKGWGTTYFIKMSYKFSK